MRAMLMIVLTATLVWAGQRAAVLTDVKGAVFLSDPAGRTPVSLLRVLEEGQQLELEPGSKVALACFGDGRTDLVTGPCRIQVGLQKTVLKAGSAGQIKSVPAGQSRALVPRGENLERLGGSMQAYLDVNKATTPPLFMQMGVRFAEQTRFTSPPHFRLKAFSPAQLTLLDRSSKVLWTKTTDRGEVRGPKLPPGSYRLKAVDQEGIESELAFEVISQTESNQVALARKEAAAALKARPGDLSPRILLIGAYLERGLLSEAWDEAGKVLRSRPDDPQSKALVRGLNDMLYPMKMADTPQPR